MDNLDLLYSSLYQNQSITVYSPNIPRVPHHLSIALNRMDIREMNDLLEVEWRELFQTINKIAEIYYHFFSISGFVIALFEKAQTGHRDRFVIELIPHLPGFNKIKNIADKFDCYRYLFFRDAPLTALSYPTPQKTIDEHRDCWKWAFQTTVPPIPFNAFQISFPFIRAESHLEEAKAILRQHLLELFEQPGGRATMKLLPSEIPLVADIVRVSECAFCNLDIIQKQRVCEYQSAQILYNIRKGEKPGCNFLALPKRHTEKVYGLTSSEILDLLVLSKALIRVLKKMHPTHEVVSYIQDDPSVGQTVFHQHIQIVSINPKTFCYSWTLQSLFPNGRVSDVEMEQVTLEFREKLKEELPGCS